MKVSQALEWDLTHRNLMDSDVENLLQGLEQSDWRPSAPIFHLNLMFNRFTVTVLPSIFQFLSARDGVTVNVGFNHFSALDLQQALQQASLSHWLGKRVFHEIGEISRHLSNTAVLLERHQVFVDGWTKHSNKDTEQEVTAAVVKHLKDSVQLQITQIIRDDGTVLCEFDGAVMGKLDTQAVLVFVEAKHCIKAEHLDSETRKGVKQAIPLQVKLKIMQDWLNDLREPNVPDNARRQRQLERQYDEYKRYKELPVQGAIGGPTFDTALQNRARKMRFLCVTCSGNRYAVA